VRNGFAVIAGTANPTVQLHHRLRRGSKDDGEQEQDSGANQRRNGAAKSAFLQGQQLSRSRAKKLMK
jgi:hypothetical protein